MISNLTKLIPPPKKPIETGDKRDWEAVIDRLGTELPNDFFDLGMTYGSGWFCEGYIRVANPFAGYVDYVDYRTISLLKPIANAIPYEPFPKAGGLLAVGDDENGGHFYWKMQGNPADWPIVFFNHELHCQEFAISLTDFLAQGIAGKIKVWLKIPKRQRTFESRPTRDLYSSYGRAARKRKKK